MLAVLEILLLSPADGASNGKLGSGAPYCWNAQSPIGCHPNDWENGDPLQCTNPYGPMEWAGRPKYSSLYELYVEGNPGVYIPGEWLTVVLRVKRYPHKYRGLVLHASSSTDTHTGEWRVSGCDEDKHFWNPTDAKECVMHSHADLKPLQSVFRFKAPPAGAGDITFRALIKEGPANEGFFYHPNGHRPYSGTDVPTGGFPGFGTDVVLKEGAARESKMWSMASEGISCTEHCASKGQTCDDVVLRSLGSPAAMESMIASISGCSQPFLPSCSNVVPAMDGNGSCYYNGVDSGVSGLCKDPSPSSSLQATCGTKFDGATRFCACTARADLTGGSIVGSNALLLLPILVMANLFAKKVWRNTGTSTGVVFLGLALGVPVGAHNWMRTPARKAFEASTTWPFVGRRPSVDIHAQLGPGERMAVKFATGHGKFHYFAILAAKDEAWTRSPGYREMVNDYIVSAPSAENRADEWPRLHSCKDEANCEDTNYFAGEVLNTEADFCDHPNHPARSRVVRWKSEFLTEDSMVFYENPKYPWIVGAARYNTPAHMPNDEDHFCMPVPRGKNAGSHHLVHWFWAGYSDVIDVHVLDKTVGNALIYGEDTGKYAINKIDHCQFVNPAGIMSEIRESTASAKPCLDDLTDFQLPNKWIEGGVGVQVVPQVNPETTLPGFKYVRMIPVSNGSTESVDGYRWPLDYLHLGLDSPTMTLTGTETYSKLDWTWWTSVTDITANTRCNEGQQLANLAEALDRCNRVDACWGISWKHNGNGERDLDAMAQGSQDIMTCEGSGTSSNNDWHLYRKPSAPTGLPDGFTDPLQWTDTNHPVYKIAFQPKNSDVSLGNDWLIDNGETFGNRLNGISYGWKCPVEVKDQAGPREVRDSSDYETIRGFVHRDQWKKGCNGGPNAWEIAIPNGVYVVTVFVGYTEEYNLHGSECSVENVGFTVRTKGETRFVTNTVTAEVLDGRLTLSALRRWHYGVLRDRVMVGCPPISWIKIDKLQNSVPRAWVPTSGKGAEAWWQMELDGSGIGVGIVSIELPFVERTKKSSYPTNKLDTVHNGYCSHWWFLKAGVPKCNKQQWFCSIKPQIVPDLYQKGLQGSKLVASKSPLGNGSPRIVGPVSGSEDGAIVSLSEVPCDDAVGCDPIDEKICDVITNHAYCERETTKLELCPIIVDCKGAKGKYVRVRLRGEDRFLGVRSIKVFRSRWPREKKAKEAVNGSKPMLCYGVQLEVPSITAPAIMTTTDSYDPIFYSTCYTKQKAITWVPIPDQVKAPPRYQFGGRCLSCTSFGINKDAALETTPQWWLSSTCKSCSNSLPTWGESAFATDTTQLPVPDRTPEPTVDPTSFSVPDPTLEPTNYPTEDPTEHAMSSGIDRKCVIGAFRTVMEIDVSNALSASLTSLELPEGMGDEYGCVFTFYLALSQGSHEFALESNDGSELLINGQTVVQNDGKHQARVKINSISTSGGTFKILYFQRGGSQSLALNIDGNPFEYLGSPTLEPTNYPTEDPTNYPTEDPTNYPTSSGISRKCVRGSFKSVTEVDVSNANEAIVKSFRLPKGMGDAYGCVFTFDLALTPGLHEFALESNDGSELLLNGQTIVANDGKHKARVRKNTVSTSGGTFTILYFQWKDSQFLSLNIDGVLASDMF